MVRPLVWSKSSEVFASEDFGDLILFALEAAPYYGLLSIFLARGKAIAFLQRGQTGMELIDGEGSRHRMI